jgi:hypothetical protein
MRRFVPAIAFGIAGFHIVLLVRRFAEGELDPAALFRWSGAFLLLGAALWLRRHRVPLLWGRQALVFWLLVLLLHAGAPPSAPAPAWMVVPVFALWAAVAARPTQRLPRPTPSRTVAMNTTAPRRREIRLIALLSPRPPPTRLPLRVA